MFELILYILGMVAIIYLLKYPIDVLEESMVGLSRKFKLSSLVAGATFIAVTSSSPEFGTAFAGVVFEHTFEIGFQTIIWSAIFNILVITGTSGIVSPTPVKINGLVLKRDIFCYIIILAFFLFFLKDKTLVWWENFCLIVIYFAYLYFLKHENSTEKIRGKDLSKQKIITKCSIGLLGVLILTTFLVELGVTALKQLGVLLTTIIPISIFACTFWGPGTSIIDLMLSSNLSRKGLGDTGVVNGIASNTFDIAICLGFNGLLYNMLVGPININLASVPFSIILLVISLIIVTLLLYIRRTLHKFDSWLLVVIFGIMLIFQIFLAFRYGY